MKPWQMIALGAAVAAVLVYVYVNRGFGMLPFQSKDAHSPASASSRTSGRPAHITWETVNRPDDGFKVDMPSDATDEQVPAYNETGTTEPVKLIVSHPDSDTTFAISWEDNPPVARVNDRDSNKTLDMARDGMLMRTQTTMVSENRITVASHPGRDIMAHNTGGGVLSARLIYTGDRLYTLIAVFPSSGARGEDDVKRFFGSFAPSQVPGTALPEAPANSP